MKWWSGLVEVESRVRLLVHAFPGGWWTEMGAGGTISLLFI